MPERTLREQYLQAENEKLLAQQQLLIQRNKNTIRQSRLWIIIIILLFWLIALLFLFFYKNKKMRKERNRMMEQINQLLNEKNRQIATLNEELNHRVKNNLAFVWSLLRMQSRRLNSPEAKAAVKEAESRVEAMALVHRRLYENEKKRTIEMFDYLSQLCNYLIESYTSINQHVIIQTNLERLTLEADTAVQIGLIVNELMTNSFKHAFKSQEYPVVKISLKKMDDEGLQLIYHDNGKGGIESQDILKNDSLGLKLIHDLTDQLNGTLQISNKEGAYFHFKFEDLK